MTTKYNAEEHIPPIDNDETTSLWVLNQDNKRVYYHYREFGWFTEGHVEINVETWRFPEPVEAKKNVPHEIQMYLNNSFGIELTYEQVEDIIEITNRYNERNE